MSLVIPDRFPSQVIEIVTWYDAISQDEWITNLDKLPKMPPVWNVGFIVHEDEDSLTMSMTSGRNEKGEAEFGPVFVIPKGMIVQRSALAYPHA